MQAHFAGRNLFAHPSPLIVALVMPRGGGRGANRGGGKTRASKGTKGRQPSGIEKYGKDEADEVLRLDEDDDASSEDGSLEDGLEEEDVMALEDNENETAWAPRGAASTGTQEVEEADEEDVTVGSKGWKRHEFYGGDDAGDESDAGSEEDLVYEEARRLQELRAKQLGGEDDFLASLLSGPTEQTAASPEVEEGLAKATATAAATNAQFESVFAAEAEHDTVPRDLEQLPQDERRGLMKKEAPELVPLLGDFKAKLAGLRELLPLLRTSALKRMPASGASYLEAKASLLLNTLANLSFYLLLRAEGGAVRSHPVVPQLVWLRELHEQLAPLDKQLSPKIGKALRIAKRLHRTTGVLPAANAENGGAHQATPVSQEQRGTPLKASLRQRIERLRPVARLQAEANRKEKRQPKAAPLAEDLIPSTKDLLRLPKVKRAGKTANGTAAGNAPLDLDEVDPTLGAWMPRSTIGEQLSAVKQQLRDQTVKEKAEKTSGDINAEARPRRTRERVSLEPDLVNGADRGERGGPMAGGREDGEQHDLIKQACEVARVKKERKTKAEEAKEGARILRQYQPEEVSEGRRKTSKRILDNRGLVRRRKKISGNARVANRKKYEKAVKKRKGAVLDMREAASDGAGYSGEATGIRTHVRKSIRVS